MAQILLPLLLLPCSIQAAATDIYLKRLRHKHYIDYYELIFDEINYICSHLDSANQ